MSNEKYCTAAYVATEVQLIKEDQWLKNALEQIKKQRNAVQVERLHLENMLVKRRFHIKDNSAGTSKEGNENTLFNLPNDVDVKSSTSTNDVEKAFANLQAFTIDTTLQESNLVKDDACNMQVLDLNVNTYGFNGDSEENYEDGLDVEEFDDDNEETFDLNLFLDAENHRT